VTVDTKKSEEKEESKEEKAGGEEQITQEKEDPKKNWKILGYSTLVYKEFSSNELQSIVS